VFGNFVCFTLILDGFRLGGKVEVVVALGGGYTITGIALFNKVASVFKGFNVSKVREILGPESVEAKAVISGYAFKEFNGEFAVSPAVFNFRFKRRDGFAHFN